MVIIDHTLKKNYLHSCHAHKLFYHVHILRSQTKQLREELHIRTI